MMLFLGEIILNLPELVTPVLPLLAVINQLIEVLCWELREYCREFSLGNSLVGKSSVIFYK